MTVPFCHGSVEFSAFCSLDSKLSLPMENASFPMRWQHWIGTIILNIVNEAGRGFGWRHFQLALLSLGLALAYSCRINLSLCIVAMTSNDTSPDHSYPVYDWGQRERGLVLSSFFWGYVLMQVPGATLANRYGPARFVLIGVTGCGLLTCISPLVAAWGGWQLMCALRMVEGLCQGVIFPSVHFLLGRWCSPVERGRAAALVYTGPSVGTLGAMGGVGLLCGSALGWPSGFYVPGGLALIWGVVWFRLAADSPAQCTRISAKEREFLKTALGDTSSGEKGLAVPWLAIFRTPAMWAVIVTHVAHNFGHWLMLTQMPNYMKTMLHFDIKQNGLYSSLPYFSLVLASVVVGWAAQRVNESHVVSLAASRKIFNSIGQYGMSCAFLLLALLTVPVEVAVALLTLAVTLESAIVAGFLVNHVDLSPNFGGAMLGVSNGLGNVMGILAPLVVSVVVGDPEAQSAEQLAKGWSNIFLIGACVYGFGNTVFLILGRADVQPWNNQEEKSKGVIPAEEHELLSKV